MRRISYLLIVLALVAVWSCSETDPITQPAPDTGGVSFARFHAIGNSLTAGFQSGGLVDAYQNVSIVAMIAQAAAAGTMEQPLVSEDGIPPTLYVSDYSGPTISQLPTMGLPENATYAGIYNNLGIPGATLNELLTSTPAQGGMFALILRNLALGATAVDQMVNAQPTMAMVWAGSNDVLGSALAGTDLGATDPAAFESDYITMMNAITGASGATVAGNIVDVTAIPYFTTIPPVVVNPATREPVLDPSGNPIPLIGINQGTPGQLPLNSLILLSASSALQQGIGIPTQLGGTGLPLPDSLVLDPTEVSGLQAATQAFNTTIDTVCANRGVPVADIYSLMNDVAANGALIHADYYYTDFLSGGLFSVDGVHPSSLGYWLAAKEFIEAINSGYGAAIPAPKLPLGQIRELTDATYNLNGLQAAYALSPADWEDMLAVFRR